ncbi:MAG: hypothetical protein RI897_2488 [Verrucomicrobiota bacterium]
MAFDLDDDGGIGAEEDGSGDADVDIGEVDEEGSESVKDLVFDEDGVIARGEDDLEAGGVFAFVGAFEVSDIVAVADDEFLDIGRVGEDGVFDEGEALAGFLDGGTDGEADFEGELALVDFGEQFSFEAGADLPGGPAEESDEEQRGQGVIEDALQLFGVGVDEFVDEATGGGGDGDDGEPAGEEDEGEEDSSDEER